MPPKTPKPEAKHLDVKKVGGVPIDKIPFGIQVLVRKLTKADVAQRVNASGIKEHVQIKEGPQGTILVVGRLINEVQILIQSIASADAVAQQKAALAARSSNNP
jgi:hypothetical protein